MAADKIDIEGEEQSFRQVYLDMFRQLHGDREEFKRVFQQRLSTDKAFREAFVADSFARRIAEIASYCATQYRNEVKHEALLLGMRPTTGADGQKAPQRREAREALVRTLFDSLRLYDGTLYGDATVAVLTRNLEGHLRNNLTGAASHARLIFTTRQLMTERSAAPGQRVRDLLKPEEAQNLLEQAEQEAATRAQMVYTADV